MDIAKGIAKVLAKQDEMQLKLAEMDLRLDEMSAALTELADKVPAKTTPKLKG